MKRLRGSITRSIFPGLAALLGVLAVLTVQTAVAAAVDRPPGGGDAASVGAEWGCDGVVTVTSQHRALSNIVILSDGGEVKVEFDDESEVFSYAFDAGDHPGLWAVDVKAGNNGHRGRGASVLLEPGSCEPVVGVGLLQFKLTWDTEADLDLYVTEPDGTIIFYGNAGPTSTDGQLDRDDNFPCGTGIDFDGGLENVFWDDDNPPASGTYTAQVVMGDPCDEVADQDPTSYVLEVFVEGVRQDALTTSGTVNPSTAALWDTFDSLTYVHP